MAERRLPFPDGYLYGEIGRTVKVAGLALTRTVYVPGYRIPRHAHEHARFVVTLRGDFTETYERRTRICRQRDVVFRPEGEVHADRFHERGGACLRVDVEPSWIARARELHVVLDRSMGFRGGPIAQLALKLEREFDEMDDVSPLVIEGLVSEIAALASRAALSTAEETTARWLEWTRDLLEARLAEHPALGPLARTVGVHPVHLARAFRKRYGRSVGEYVRQLRVESACERLSASDAPLGEVAAETGFADQSHFTRTFKRYTGRTPGEYRRAFRGA